MNVENDIGAQQTIPKHTRTSRLGHSLPAAANGLDTTTDSKPLVKKVDSKLIY